MDRLRLWGLLPCLLSSPAWAEEVAVSVNLLTDHSWVNSSEAEKKQAHRGLLTLEGQWQLDANWLLAGNLKAFRGNNGETLTDNIQGISNIDAEHFSKLYEAYLQYQFSADSRAKCGQVDANLEFAFIPAAAGFISPPLGITPTAIALPTYYDPALSCSVFYQPEQGFQWMGGFFAGGEQQQFAEQFYVAEGRYVDELSRWSYGYWRHNGDWADVVDQQLTAIGGWYLNYQRQLNPDWTLFLLWSELNDNVDVSRQHRMVGVVRQFEQQQLGLMVSTCCCRKPATNCWPSCTGNSSGGII